MNQFDTSALQICSPRYFSILIFGKNGGVLLDLPASFLSSFLPFFLPFFLSFLFLLLFFFSLFFLFLPSFLSFLFFSWRCGFIVHFSVALRAENRERAEVSGAVLAAQSPTLCFVFPRRFPGTPNIVEFNICVIVGLCPRGDPVV